MRESTWNMTDFSFRLRLVFIFLKNLTQQPALPSLISQLESSSVSILFLIFLDNYM